MKYFILQTLSRSMAKCVYARGANYERAQNCTSKLVHIFILHSKRHFFIIRNAYGFVYLNTLRVYLMMNCVHRVIHSFDKLSYD